MQRIFRFIFLFAIILICFWYFKPIEKIIWSIEQAKLADGDIVVYSQWSDRFGWDKGCIYSAYRQYSYQYSYGISNEKAYTDKKNKIKNEEIFSKLDFPNNTISDVEKIEIDAKKIPDSKFKILLNYELKSYLEYPQNYNSTMTFYIWQDKYLISANQEKISERYAIVNIYDIEKGEIYHYPQGITANKPKRTDVSDRLINPRYYMYPDGKLYCIYKCYNKLYCHRLN